MILGYYNLPLSQCCNFTEDIVLVGVPYDSGSRFLGAAQAPNRLRKLSRKVFVGKTRYLMRQTGGALAGFYNHATSKQLLAGRTVADYGNMTLATIKKNLMSRRCSCIPIFIGGDHSITYHILRGLNNQRPVSLFYFDAHEDVADRVRCCRNNNVVSWVRTLPNVKDIFHIGLRGYSCRPVCQGVFSNIITASDFRWSPPAPKRGEECYVSIDLDVLDPYVFPCVSTPVIGGVNFQELTRMLYKIFARYRVTGIDIVEYVPRKDVNDLSGLLVLDLVLQILEMIDSSMPK